MISIQLRVEDSWIRFESDTPENLLMDVHSMIKAGMNYEPFIELIPGLVNPFTSRPYKSLSF